MAATAAQGTFQEIGLKRGERVVGIGVVKEGAKLVIGTTAGMIKRVELADVLSSRAEATWAAIIGLNGGGGEEVLFAGVASDAAHVMICTSGNKKLAPRVLRFEAGPLIQQAYPFGERRERYQNDGGSAGVWHSG